jgi:hypothetical protein
MSDAAFVRALGGPPSKPVRMLRVKITAYAAGSPPSLSVQLPDGSTIPAVPVTGLSYTVGGWGVAFYSEGVQPPVLPTA